MNKEVWKVWKKTYSRRWGHIIWEVSDQGNVKKNGVLYECRLDKKGYKIFGTGWTLHRSVAELFIPNPNSYNEIDHINGNRLDNRAINLQWCTHKQNLNNPITRKRRSESMKGKPQSEEHRKHISKSMKGKNTDPKSEEHRKHISKSLKGRQQSEEHKRKRSEAMKIYWQNKRNEKQNH